MHLLRIPDGLRDVPAHHHQDLPGAQRVRYRNPVDLAATQVLLTHPTWVLIHSGAKRLSARGSTQVLQATPGTLLAMRSGTHIMAEHARLAQPYTSTILGLERSLLAEILGPLPGPGPSGRACTVRASPRLRECFAELGQDGLAREEQRLRLWAVVVEGLQEPALRSLMQAELHDWGDSTEQRIRRVMENHHLSPMAVPDYAALCGMSLSSFKRSFSRIYDQSPGRWLSASRLHHARAMLLNSSRSVTEVCLACGYEDLSNFGRAFRRRWGVSPRGARASLG